MVGSGTHQTLTQNADTLQTRTKTKTVVPEDHRIIAVRRSARVGAEKMKRINP